MVVGEMSSFSLPPSLRRGAERASGESASSRATNGMKNFMTGMMSPFTACWQPDIGPCVPVCGPDYHRRRHSANQASGSGPAVVSPLMDRMNPPKYDIPTSPVTSTISHYQARSPNSSVTGKEDDAPTAPADIEKPHSNDVLCGRGGSSNRHLGNMHFRELVAANKKMYVGLTKKQKMLVARKIVEMVHSTDPPGRFLAKDLDTGLWYDIGLPRSLEKTSQALREKNSNDYPTEEGLEVTDVLSEASLPYSPRSDSGVSSPTSIDDEKECAAKSNRSSKHVEAPPLIIPPHLGEVFGPKKNHESHHGWQEYSPSRNLEQPYLPTYPPPGPPSPHRDHYSVPPRSQHYDAAPRSPHPYHGGHYARHEHGGPYRSPHYGDASPLQDYREHYEYYPRHQADYAPRDHYGQPSPHRAPPPPPPPAHHYRAYPPPPPPPGPPPRPYGQHRHPPPPPPPHHHRSAMHGPPEYQYPHHYHQGSGHGRPYGPPPPHNGATPPATPPPPSSATPQNVESALVVKSPSSGYVRSKSEISPERRQEWKRQRSEKGAPRRLNSDTALSYAVENSLTLEERVVGRERGAPAPAAVGSRPAELPSPSGALQGRSRPRGNEIRSASVAAAANLTKEEGAAVSALSGLAALSTAAFLKLDEAS